MNITESAIREIVNYVLLSVGYWGIFKKCGVKPYLSLVPFVREYNLSLCADREKDGRRLTIVSLALEALAVIILAQEENSDLVVFLSMFFLALVLTKIIYSTRVYFGLTKVFNRRKSWTWLFVFLELLTLLIWGWHPAFVPSKKVDDPSDLTEAKGLGEDVRGETDGLTVNINSRTVIDFFTKKTLLKDIHMIIPRGHMVLLLGGSGAGKTTFVNAVTGYEKADATINLGKDDVYNDYDKLMYDIGFVPQQDLMRGSDTVLATLSDAATLRLSSSVGLVKRRERIAEVLEQFGLSAVQYSLVDKLSGGQKKRLSIAMEFISDPTLFFLDEPDSGLDGVVARALFEKLRAIANEGKIVVVITHTPDRVIDLFDDVIVLAKDSSRTGRLAYYGPVKDSYEFFGKKSMEEILLSINQKDEGGEGRADEFVEKYVDKVREKVG
ncbi:MAG: ABC transporter ATP-binding protein [Butyrivibrio sp.]|nr:ABC transporter ATP-binding protein [Butyrivibrio sp.]